MVRLGSQAPRLPGLDMAPRVAKREAMMVVSQFEAFLRSFRNTSEWIDLIPSGIT